MPKKKILRNVQIGCKKYDDCTGASKAFFVKQIAKKNEIHTGFVCCWFIHDKLIVKFIPHLFFATVKKVVTIPGGL